MYYIMNQEGGKKHTANPYLKAWRIHVNKVAKTEKIGYGKKAMQDAKKGKFGQQWETIKASIKKSMKGGIRSSGSSSSSTSSSSSSSSSNSEGNMEGGDELSEKQLPGEEFENPKETVLPNVYNDASQKEFEGEYGIKETETIAMGGKRRKTVRRRAAKKARTARKSRSSRKH